MTFIGAGTLLVPSAVLQKLYFTFILRIILPSPNLTGVPISIENYEYLVTLDLFDNSINDYVP